MTRAEELAVKLADLDEHDPNGVGRDILPLVQAGGGIREIMILRPEYTRGQIMGGMNAVRRAGLR